jgi:hypothetical protein
VLQIYLYMVLIIAGDDNHVVDGYQETSECEAHQAEQRMVVHCEPLSISLKNAIHGTAVRARAVGVLDGVSESTQYLLTSSTQY